MLGALGLLAYMALQVGALRGLGKTVDLRVKMHDAAGLAEGAEVKIAGVDVGHLGSLGIEHDQAVLHLQIRQDAEVRQDARVAVRARSVLGEKFVEIVPQSVDAPLAQDGDELQSAPPPLEIDQLVNALGPLVQAIDPEDLGRSVEIMNQALARDPERVDRMLVDLETLLHNAALASDQLPGVIDDTRATLRSVQDTSARARPVLARADRISVQVEAATTDLAQTRAQVDGLLVDSRKVVDDGGRLVGRLDGTVDRADTVLDNFAEFDKWELRRLLREEGILVRIRRQDVVEDEELHGRHDKGGD